MDTVGHCDDVTQAIEMSVMVLHGQNWATSWIGGSNESMCDVETRS